MTISIVWKSISIKPEELCLAKVLRCGQTFRWHNINDVWTYSISDRIVLLKQDESNIHYSQIMGHDKDDNYSQVSQETLRFIEDYFNLSVNLQSLYNHWSLQHKPFSKTGKSSPFEQFTGIRILRQDPWECLVSFICSSNNNVKRISKMCDSLTREFGHYINEYQGMKYYSFPSPEALSEKDVEAKLRQLGFGYRARYIYQSACKMTNGELSIERLNKLRFEHYDTAHEYLLKLTGVGPKVADCICLMSLDKHDIVPVDTHVYQIAMRDYRFKGKKDLKTLNKQVYGSIRLHFKEIFGDYAGWAQSVLFAADLSDLNNGINKKVKVEDSVKEEL